MVVVRGAPHSLESAAQPRRRTAMRRRSRIYRANRRRRLTPKPTRLAHLLLRHAARLLRRATSRFHREGSW